MTRPTEPFNSARIGVSNMVDLGFSATVFAGLALDIATENQRVGIGPTFGFHLCLRGKNLIAVIAAHLRCVALKTISLRWGPLRLSAILAAHSLRHTFQHTRKRGTIKG